jgi:hypothetical protein
MLEVLAGTRSTPMLTQRAHFWLRIVGLAVILAAEFAPRLWANTAGPTQARMSAVADGR